MRTIITRGFAAALAAGAMLAGPSFAGPAQAAPHSAGPVIYTTDHAGYQAGGGRYFRFVAATVTVPPAAGNNAAAYVSLRSATKSWLYASLIAEPGGGARSVWYSFGSVGNFLVDMSPRVGDQLSLRIFYDQPSGHTILNVVDGTRHLTAQLWGHEGRIVYDYAQAGAMALSSVVPGAAGLVPGPAASSSRLWQLTGTAVATYSGVRGSLLGPWLTSSMIMTATGRPSGTVVMSPSYLWDGGRNFGIWQR